MKHTSLLFFFLSFSFFCFAKPASTPSLGTLQRDTIMGIPCQVYLPAGYSKAAKRHKQAYPCLYLHHGMFGSENDWPYAGKLLPIMDSLLRSGSVKEMVVVMPDNFLGSLPVEIRDSFMHAPAVRPDGTPFSQEYGAFHFLRLEGSVERAYEMSGYWEEHFPEFMQAVESRYFVSREAKNRAVAGLSMGGFHTMHVSHYLAGQFGYIGLFSAVILPLEPNSEMFSSDITGFAKQLPYASPAYAHWMEDMSRVAASHPIYWIGMGREDFLYEQMCVYRKWLDAHNFEYTYYESDGGHTWENWQDYLPRFLQLCFSKR